MKKIALVGCSGSIGRQVVAVVQAHPDAFKIVAIIANSSSQILEEQMAVLHPLCAAMVDEGAAQNVTKIPYGTAFYSGEKDSLALLESCGADVVFVACGGFAGLKYSLKTLELGLDLALANKETLVCGGDLVANIGGNILPVDSEHSAIWQCLNYNRKARLKNLIITASGGPFKNCKWEDLRYVTPQTALNHPTWKMGKKITIDSATLLNKGYEVIEAHHLYGTPYEHIKTVIQPQSIIHSMVEFDDGAILAQLSNPTMELPIQLALTYPERLDCNLKPMDFSTALTLEFLPLVRENYPMYDLALTCGQAGGILPTILNAASEVADYAFLDGKIAFTDIFTVAEKLISTTNNCAVSDYYCLEKADADARKRAEQVIKKLA